MWKKYCIKKQQEGNWPVLSPNSDSQGPVIMATVPLTTNTGEVDYIRCADTPCSASVLPWAAPNNQVLEISLFILCTKSSSTMIQSDHGNLVNYIINLLTL